MNKRRHIRNLAGITVLLIMAGCASFNGSHKPVSIIPLPSKIDYSGGMFRLKKHVNIGYFDLELEPAINLIKGNIEKHGLLCTTKKLETISDSDQMDIFVQLDSNNNIPPEGYQLIISKSGCKLTASTLPGIFYGAQSLYQLILQSPKHKLIIPTLTITDSPRFTWRGMHLDVSRHFMPKEFIKEYIDYLAFLKMNVFHWHLVDDQGWRVEIKRYPKLTEIGAWRDSTWMGHNDDGTGKYDRKRYGGYYTQEDIRNIVNYAAERFITVVPEIEIPGHSQSAIASYPELGCTDDTIGVLPKWGISPYIYNIDESTFDFLFGVLDEIIELFPSSYIHIGGDEALKDQWKSSKKIQQQMRCLDIKDETALQSYFTGRIEKYLRSKGRNIIGWDEILEGGLPEEAAVMSWRGTEGGIAAAKSGHKVVMTPTEYCYLDYYQSENTTEPLAIGGYLPVEKVYSFNPVPAELNEEESKLIIGVQGNVWTEYMDSPEKVQYMIFPRIFAMAEMQWTPQDKRDYSDFAVRMRALEVFMKENKINYAKHCFLDRN